MSFLNEIEKLEDHRVDANKDYDLIDIVFLTMSAVLCGAKGWKAIQIFGEYQLDWLRQYREFPNGIPTRHSIGRIIRGIKAESIISCFIAWSNGLRNKGGKEHISLDGKVIRGSKHGEKPNALQFMTAMVVDSGLIIYQKETDSKTNEIPVMQSILADLEINGSVITADAMHCQKKTAEIICEKDGDYVLQVKKNQAALLKEIKAYFHKIRRDDPLLLNRYEDVDGEHGRINERCYQLLPLSNWCDEANKWKGSHAVIEVTRKRTVSNKTSEETSYYITSLEGNINSISGYIRQHWSIENSQHWVLDVTFGEDECQIYADDGARNLCTFRRALLGLLKENSFKDSVAGKMQRACWDQNFRAEVLFG
ncbi:MAG: ISAs1 family transposase [Alteromonadales bacterium]|nr:ISAs1 family transposase [Alteromonadales bacterium]